VNYIGSCVGGATRSRAYGHQSSFYLATSTQLEVNARPQGHVAAERKMSRERLVVQKLTPLIVTNLY